MMKKYSFILWAALTMTGAFTACTDNDSPMAEQAEAKTVTIRATINGDIGSRVDLTDDAENRSVKVDWKQGDDFKINVNGADYTFTYNENTEEFAYDNQNGAFPATFTSAGIVTATYPATVPTAYATQSGTLEGAANFITMTATLDVEANQSTGKLDLVFEHTTSIVKLTLTNEAFKNQNVGVKLYAENLLLDKGGHLITGNGALVGNANGSVIAYFAVPGHSIDETYQSLDCRIYATVGNTTYRTTLNAKYLFAGKLYNVVKDKLTITEDFQSTAMLLPTGRNFNIVVGQAMEANASLKKIKFMANSQNTSGTPLFTDVNNKTMYAVANGEWLEIHTSAAGFQANTDCGGMFRGATTGTYKGNVRFAAVTEIDLTGVYTSGVTDMYNMFGVCSNLTTLTLGNDFNTANVKDMEGMFSSCSKLTSLDLTNFSFEGNPSVNLMFNGTGSSAADKPITIKVTQDGYDYLSSKNTDINSDYAKIVANIRIKTAAEAVKGDYAMADGTFISKDITLTDTEKSNVRGIVFWTENEDGYATLASDEILKKDYPNYNHGLIVSLKNVSKKMAWQSTAESVHTFQTGNNFTYPDKSSYKSIYCQYNDANGTINSILGYQNTKILKAYNEQCADANKVLPVGLLATWAQSNPAPTNTTGWYLPSEKELSLLCGKDVQDLFTTKNPGTENKVYINDILEKLSTSTRDLLSDTYYWSSTEHSSANNYYFSFTTNGGSMSYYEKKYDAVISGANVYNCNIRAVCAF